MLCELIRNVQFLKKDQEMQLSEWLYYYYFATTGKFRLLMLAASRRWEQEYIYN
jgi:hypothetical protein